MVGVSVSGYYCWRRRPPSARSVRHGLLLEVIAEIHQASRRSASTPKHSSPTPKQAAGSTKPTGTAASSTASRKARAFQPQDSQDVLERSILSHTILPEESSHKSPTVARRERLSRQVPEDIRTGMSHINLAVRLGAGK